VSRSLRRERVRRAVEMRSEVRALLIDRPPRRETEHLVAAAVGEDRPVPADKPMESAAPRDELVARPQIQVIRVGEQDRRTHRLEVAVRDAFDRALCADGHERRRLHGSMRRRQHTAPRTAVGVRHAEGKRHVLSLSNVRKLRVGVIYGGRSGEHEVSLASAAAVFKNLDPDRYEAVPIKIEKDGRWTLPSSPPLLDKAADAIAQSRQSTSAIAASGDLQI